MKHRMKQIKSKEINLFQDKLKQSEKKMLLQNGQKRIAKLQTKKRQNVSDRIAKKYNKIQNLFQNETKKIKRKINYWKIGLSNLKKDKVYWKMG